MRCGAVAKLWKADIDCSGRNDCFSPRQLFLVPRRLTVASMAAEKNVSSTAELFSSVHFDSRLRTDYCASTLRTRLKTPVLFHCTPTFRKWCKAAFPLHCGRLLLVGTAWCHRGPTSQLLEKLWPERFPSERSWGGSVLSDSPHRLIAAAASHSYSVCLHGRRQRRVWRIGVTIGGWPFIKTRFESISRHSSSSPKDTPLMSNTFHYEQR